MNTDPSPEPPQARSRAQMQSFVDTMKEADALTEKLLASLPAPAQSNPDRHEASRASRAAFEDVARAQGTERNAYGMYANPLTQRLWEAWRLALDYAAQQAAPSLEMRSLTIDERSVLDKYCMDSLLRSTPKPAATTGSEPSYIDKRQTCDKCGLPHTGDHRCATATEAMAQINEGKMTTPQTTPSDTPETDAVAHHGYKERAYILFMTDCARRLERGRAAAQAEARRLHSALEHIKIYGGFETRTPCGTIYHDGSWCAEQAREALAGGREEEG